MDYNEPSIPSSIREEFRCCVCKGYLSCSPVRVTPDGYCICGNCSAPNPKVLAYRVRPLEVVLRKMYFPCRFKNYGCPGEFLFGYILGHESKCDRRLVMCPLLPQSSCLWKGTIMQIFDHVSEKHSSFVTENARFEIQLDRNVEGALMVKTGDVPFVIKFMYNSKNHDLCYHIRYCNTTLDSNSVTFNTRLINANTWSSINLKASYCKVFHEDYYNMQKGTILHLNKFLECLDNPSKILVVVNFTIYKPQPELSASRFADYNLRCDKCQNCLAAPLFDLDKKTVCNTCAKNYSDCIPTKKCKLEKEVGEAIYYCRWNKCKFAGNSYNCNNHEKTCAFRSYGCIYPDCNFTSAPANFIYHLEGYHGAYYIKGYLEYKASFSRPYKNRDTFTYDQINKRIILVSHSMVYAHKNPRHEVQLYTIGTSNNITLQFAHRHCKITSKEFKLEGSLQIGLEDLPPCFTAEQWLAVFVNYQT